MKTKLHFRSLSMLILSAVLILGSFSCSPKLSLSSTNPEVYSIDPSKPRDSAMLAFYWPYKLRLDSVMNEIVAISEIEITKGRPEGPLNNLMADAMYHAAKSNHIDFDFVMTNYGGLRLPLPEGPIPLYKIFELMPFENTLTTVELSASDTQELFDFMAANGGEPISGATFKIKDKRAEDITINGKPFSMNRTYKVLTSDYLANGGDNAVVFERSLKRMEYPIKLRDVIIAYLKQLSAEGKKINPKVDGRITVE